MPKTAVVALGGNALTRAGQSGTYEGQTHNARTMARTVLAIRRSGWNVVIVHGNGPQVGNLAIQQEEGRQLVPAQPLFSLGAMTQGEIGSMIGLALRADEPDIAVAALITHVVVSPDDPAFASPTKPIGPFFTSERAAELAIERGWTVAEDSGRGVRRVVASPRPIEVLETSAIRSLLADGTVVVAGIAVVDVGVSKDRLFVDEHRVPDLMVHRALLRSERLDAGQQARRRLVRHLADLAGDPPQLRGGHCDPCTAGACSTDCRLLIAEQAWQRAHPAETVLASIPRNAM
jgi:hypothetical protein